MDAARAAAETVARTEYGRLLALVCARTRDVAGAEDALAEAFAAALASWPRRGVPERPAAWLLTAARRNQGHVARHRQVRSAAAAALLQLAEEAAARCEDRPGADALPDARLRLMFVCAHPAIDPAARTALMLQTVLGLDAARIAAAFLVTPAAMGQRLARAKTRIRDAGLGFHLPEAAELPQRLEFVLAAIYAAYGSAWNDGATHPALAAEAIYLARLACALLPGSGEAAGLLALLLHCQARAAARRSAAGAFVPLSAQDTALWSAAGIAEAEATLATAFGRGPIGRFQLEAAIQSAHAARAASGRTDWEGIAVLYEGLVQVSPTTGALVGRAAVLAECRGAAAGLAALDAIAATRDYQPAWVLRAHLLRCLGRDAGPATARAVALTGDAAVAEFLAGPP